MVRLEAVAVCLLPHTRRLLIRSGSDRHNIEKWLSVASVCCLHSFHLERLMCVSLSFRKAGWCDTGCTLFFCVFCFSFVSNAGVMWLTYASAAEGRRVARVEILDCRLRVWFVPCCLDPFSVRLDPLVVVPSSVWVRFMFG